MQFYLFLFLCKGERSLSKSYLGDWTASLACSYMYRSDDGP